MNNLNTRPTRVRTILFTEDCPLDCLYCNLKQNDSFGTGTIIKKQEMFKIVENIDKQDDFNIVNTRLLFTGGEPLTKWPWIKEIIEKYQNRFSYSFNTSGYLLTEEMLIFLSQYQVSFVLSVDGTEALTNYLRPLAHNPYKVGYMKQFKKIVPILLYYFPLTPFRIVVNARYVDLLYQVYQYANELGFLYFSFILDFNQQELTSPKNYNKLLKTWTEKHTKILEQQLDLIAIDILSNYKNNIKRTQLLEFNNMLKYLFNKEEFTPESMECQLFNNRSLVSMYAQDQNCSCFGKYFSDMDILKNAVVNEYNKLNHKCLLDSSCDLFEWCCKSCCIQVSYIQTGKFFNFEKLECILKKSCYKAILKFLSVGNEVCKDNFLYNQYINDNIKGE